MTQNIILDLTVPALRYAVELAELYPDYKIGVVVPDEEAAIAAMDGLTDYVDCVNLARLKTSDGRYIYFNNDSRIDVVSNVDDARGCKWNLMVMDPTIDNKKAISAYRHSNTRQYPL